MLMKRLYSIFTKPGEVVLDCFNGAGTSTLAAQQMDRGYIGVELSEDYHALALKRHEQLDLGIDPFGKVTSIPKSKNSTVERTNHFHYKVPKKDLQIYIKRLAEDLGRSPTRDDVIHRNDYPIEYFDTYFHSWSEVCAAVRATGMTEIRLANRGSTN
jgi:site-specific DNA-methyltransferase (adenine-specific)